MSDQTEAESNLANYRAKRPHNISFTMTRLTPERSYRMDYTPSDANGDVWHLYFTPEEMLDLWNRLNGEVSSITTSGIYAERRTGGPF